MQAIAGIARWLHVVGGPHILGEPHVGIDVIALDLMPGSRSAPQEAPWKCTRRGSVAWRHACRRQGSGRDAHDRAPADACVAHHVILRLTLDATFRSVSFEVLSS